VPDFQARPERLFAPKGTPKGLSPGFRPRSTRRLTTTPRASGFGNWQRYPDRTAGRRRAAYPGERPKSPSGRRSSRPPADQLIC